MGCQVERYQRLERQGKEVSNPCIVLDGTFAGMGARKFLISHLVAPMPTSSLRRDTLKFREAEERPKVTRKPVEVLLQLSQTSEKPGEGLGSSVAPECLGFSSQGWRGWETQTTSPQALGTAAETAPALSKSPILMFKLKEAWGPGWARGGGTNLSVSVRLVWSSLPAPRSPSPPPPNPGHTKQFRTLSLAFQKGRWLGGQALALTLGH